MQIETGLAGGLGLLILIVAGLALLLFLVPVRLWMAAWASGAYVGLLDLIGMRLRRVPPGTVITARISAVKTGIEVTINDLEAHFLAGGNVVRTVNAMISADKANLLRRQVVCACSAGARSSPISLTNSIPMAAMTRQFNSSPAGC